jgi:putative tRNA adenosine deaminase-associated protein
LPEKPLLFCCGARTVSNGALGDPWLFDSLSLSALDRGVSMTEETSSDFCIAVYREDEVWEAEALPVAVTENLDTIISALRQLPSIGGVLGLTAVGDDFFVITRVLGGQVTLFVSDLTASVDWPLARQVLEHLDIEVPYDEDLDQVLPAGELSILADLGVDEMELCALSGDLDLFPDEVLSSLARRIGFGAVFDRAMDAAIGQ